MPYKAKKQCARQGCPNLVKIGHRYCAAHTTEANRSYETTRRNKNIKRRYSTKAWDRLRKAKLVRNPLCEDCFAHGRIVEAEHVHHIDEVSEGGKFLPAMSELQSLCKSCHSRHHFNKNIKNKGLNSIGVGGVKSLEPSLPPDAHLPSRELSGNSGGGVK